MKSRYLGLGALAATVALLLAACGGDVNPEPDPGNPPPQPENDRIYGTLYAPFGKTLNNAWIYLCEDGSGCQYEEDVLVEVGPITGGESTGYYFYNLPDANYDLFAYMNSGVESFAWLDHVNTGSVGNDLYLEEETTAPGDGTATMTGMLYLPGAGGMSALANGAALRARASELGGVLSATAVPAGDIYLTAHNDLGAGRGLTAIPGELVVKFRDDVLFSQASLGTMSVDGVQLQHVQGGMSGQHLYRAAGLDEAGTIALAEELQQRGDVERAAPNWVLHSFASPNDSLYAFQWHYDAINMEAAWDIETGDTGVTVAVVDSGYINHPDLNFTGGYDFITTQASAGDGNGRDSDPTDIGDGSGYHGGHVAGTVGATTNNANGVAGVNWNVTVVPVRVLGQGGNGAMLDILEGTAWAAGASITGVPTNPNPADVVNLSLGVNAGVTCSQVLGGPDTFFQDLTRDYGTIFVVAAGNDNTSTDGVFPANCPGVITVGATGPGNTIAPYSNYGAAVDVMAPGGDLNATFTAGGETYPYGVLSTLLYPDGSPAYGFYQGTSMAAPHVAGVVALLLASEPGLSLSEIVNRLQSTTSTSVCSSGCGAGLIDVAAALGSSSTTPPPEPPEAGSAVTYILFSECETSACSTAIPSQYVAFDNVPAGGVPYTVTNVTPGKYYVEGWLDLDGGTVFTSTETVIDIDDGEPYGDHAPVELPANTTTPNVDLYLEYN